MEPLSHLIVSRLPRGWVGRQQAHLSLGPLGFAKGSSTASVSVERPPQKDRLVPNRERRTSRLHIVTLLI